MLLKTILVCALCYFIATFVQRVCGFGMGIVAIVVLPYLIGSHAQTAAYTNIFSAISSIVLTLRHRKNCRWRLFVPVLCGSFPITFVMVRIMNRLSFAFLEKLLGGVLVVLSLYFLFLKGKISISPRPRNGFLAGLCGGTLNSLFSAGGPPVVMYLLGTTKNYAEYFATIQGYFVFNNTYAVLIRFLNGQITPGILPGLAGGFVGMIGGNLLGGRMVKYIPEQMFLKMIYLLMAFSGVVMLL